MGSRVPGGKTYTSSPNDFTTDVMRPKYAFCCCLKNKSVKYIAQNARCTDFGTCDKTAIQRHFVLDAILKGKPGGLPTRASYWK